jgi:hypothetical protein
MQTGQIYTETRIQACVAQLGKGRKKAQGKDTDKDKTTDKNSTDNKGDLSGHTHPGASPKRRSTDTPPFFSHLPPPFSLAPPPRHPTVNTWPLLGPHTASTPFSVQQPCGSHVMLMVAATQKAPSPQSRWRPSPPWLSPGTVAGPTLPS